MEFHKRLKEFREEMGMKPAELARLLKTSPSNISRYESGKMAGTLSAPTCKMPECRLM